ncbi:pyridoxal 5'-phosphate synthase glutaminase subunit PdxT [Eubacterium sp. 1001713B170207_170306_E7]|uniref:pyridoxal 5'-phosphate synthase glutaminase subunit PdxT n=1 Tax=Eubacterium sp. 1001713B170207_170306_E7 TaxID=2787097 RepID=UPI00189A999A|nr:pyridoxal 5'-phosphate synthase glutaminase subunit PdxT [Eubacterium sp. 1001713B170207_170306_E7]
MRNGAGNKPRVGVLALQGSVEEHLECLGRLPVQGVPVKRKETIETVDAMILPGGESTTIGKLLRDFDLMAPLKKRILKGMPVWGTCAGLILLAKHLPGEVPYLEVMDIAVRRNAYGRQLDSFKTTKVIPAFGKTPVSLVFIRAPYIEAVSEDAEVLCELDGHIVAARQKNMLATAFHPELTGDVSVYRYFLRMVEQAGA